ncbi:GWxTD domain-containing protein, partial [Candidatus Neomarinimicrobiota bacterium]
ADRKKNIEKFSLTAVTKQQSASDSINVIIYMQIPNYTLQFVKHDTGFIANYEATISFTEKKGRQIGRTFWQDSILISNYEESIARLKGITLATNFSVSPGEYKYNASLYDLDTKNTGEYKAKLNLTKYSSKVTLHPPVLLVDQAGEWGFGINKIPSFFNSADEISNGLLFYISGKCAPGAYSLKYEVLSSDDEIRWSDNLNDTCYTGWFKHYLEIPSNAFDEITSKMKVTINQSGKSDSKTSKISIRHPGVSHLITDIDKALDQMNYILTSQEKAKLKRQSKKQREKLFKEFWDLRDPTPGTVSNELMEEYYKRVAYTNEHFTGIAGGWKSDMGMIYIIFGVPEDIERSVMAQSRGNYEIWYYYRISRSFIFEDRDGLGYYRLTTPFYGEPF